MAQFNLDFQLSRIECVVLQVQGKAQRRGNSRPIPKSCNAAMCLQNRTIGTGAETPTR
ncbi:hypothetical protein [Nitrosomonas sp. Is37]|uniref:hypothetical protein n=1 Tax=Nitrosomonas sp. Is37 TaxID=3080535 RepID=UPI00294AC03C|nr:hypothetical protein [Nitrosomonas sp. Is37]MDV6344441.1 hypothetical protein [Nitrosomonas sp. Is37]